MRRGARLQGGGIQGVTSGEGEMNTLKTIAFWNAFMACVFCLWGLLPDHDSNMKGGTALFALFFNTKKSRVMAAIELCVAEIMAGTAPHDIDTSGLDEVCKLKVESGLTTNAHFYLHAIYSKKYEIHGDTADGDKAKEHLLKAAQGVYLLPDRDRVHIWLGLTFHEGFNNENAEKARDAFDNLPKDLKTDPVGYERRILLAESAIAFASKEYITAIDLLERHNELLKNDDFVAMTNERVQEHLINESEKLLEKVKSKMGSSDGKAKEKGK